MEHTHYLFVIISVGAVQYSTVNEWESQNVKRGLAYSKSYDFPMKLGGN